jgi:hypothetical protein
MEGETIEITAPEGKKWVLDGSAWVPEGTTIIEPGVEVLVNWCLEPLDFSELKNVNHIHMARNKEKPERTWKLRREVEEEIPYDQMPAPQPLTEADIFKVKMDGPVAVRTKGFKQKKKEKPPVKGEVSAEPEVEMKKGPGGRMFPVNRN